MKTTLDINVSAILTLAFIILKLTHVIDWSWWFVFSPYWIPVIDGWIKFWFMPAE